MAVVAALGTAQEADAGHPMHFVPRQHQHMHRMHHHRVMPGYPVYPGQMIRPRPVMPVYSPVYPTYPGYMYPSPVYPVPVYPRTGFGIQTNDFSLFLGR